jgi:sulfoxide reductase heme-binding subunit YedZ
LNQRRITLVKWAAFVVCLVPLAVTIWKTFSGAFVNPVEGITHATGLWTLRFLIITLSITPIRRLTGWNVLIRFRRMLGLFAFFYASLHLITYVAIDQFFHFATLLEDVAKRLYITVGFTAFLLLIPLAVTSSRKSIARLGRRWQKLHRLVYVSAVGGVVHFLWLVKADLSRPLTYAAILAVLLGFRGVAALR